MLTPPPFPLRAAPPDPPLPDPATISSSHHARSCCAGEAAAAAAACLAAATAATAAAAARSHASSLIWAIAAAISSRSRASATSVHRSSAIRTCSAISSAPFVQRRIVRALWRRVTNASNRAGPSPERLTERMFLDVLNTRSWNEEAVIFLMNLSEQRYTHGNLYATICAAHAMIVHEPELSKPQLDACAPL